MISRWLKTIFRPKISLDEIHKKVEGVSSTAIRGMLVDVLRSRRVVPYTYDGSGHSSLCDELVLFVERVAGGTSEGDPMELYAWAEVILRTYQKVMDELLEDMRVQKLVSFHYDGRITWEE